MHGTVLVSIRKCPWSRPHEHCNSTFSLDAGFSAFVCRKPKYRSTISRKSRDQTHASTPRTSPDLWWAAVCSFRVSAGIGASDVKLFFNTINDSRVNFCMGDRIDHWWHVLVCDCIRGSCIKLPPDLYFNLLTALVFGPCLLPAPLIYFPTQNSLSHFLFLGIESLAHFSMAKDRSFFFIFQAGSAAVSAVYFLLSGAKGRWWIHSSISIACEYSMALCCS